jgi:hypothetical protein
MGADEGYPVPGRIHAYLLWYHRWAAPWKYRPWLKHRLQTTSPEAEAGRRLSALAAWVLVMMLLTIAKLGLNPHGFLAGASYPVCFGGVLLGWCRVGLAQMGEGHLGAVAARNGLEYIPPSEREDAARRTALDRSRAQSVDDQRSPAAPWPYGVRPRPRPWLDTEPDREGRS